MNTPKDVARRYLSAVEDGRFGDIWDLLCASDQAALPRVAYVARFEAPPEGQQYLRPGPISSVQVEGQRALVEATYMRPEHSALVAIHQSGLRGEARHAAIEALEWVPQHRTVVLVLEDLGWRVDTRLGKPSLDVAYRDGLRRIEFQLVALGDSPGRTWLAETVDGQHLRLERTFLLQPPSWGPSTVTAQDSELHIELMLNTDNPRWFIAESALTREPDRTVAVVFDGRVVASGALGEVYRNGRLQLRGPIEGVDLGSLAMVLAKRPGALRPH